MDRAEYLKIKNDQTADNTPVLYFYAKLKGFDGLGKVNNLQEFGAAFFKYIIGIMRHPADVLVLRNIVEKVDRELDVHFNVVGGR